MSSDTMTASISNAEDFNTTIPASELTQAEEKGRAVVRPANGQPTAQPTVSQRSAYCLG